MPIYQRQGEVPAKRHVVFRRDAESIFYEELIGNEGFRGASTLLYRLHRPTQLLRAEGFKQLVWEVVQDRTLRPYHFRLGKIGRGGDPFLDRTPVLFNQDVALSMACPTLVRDGFYRNSQGDELVFVAEGEGVLQSSLGEVPFEPGDYLVIPRGIVHRYRLGPTALRFFILESATPIKIPARYRNDNGQFVEGAPFCERDIRGPRNLAPRDETGEFEILTKQRNTITRHIVRTHPFDVVGWDGTYYPWAFNTRDFEPIVGKIHQPPPVHQTFQGEGFVVCSFVPRLFDFHPEAVPAPYNHSNVQSDEVLFYATDQFMSRKGIEFGSLTYHPDGIPHGPHPGTAEASIGAKETRELAVMVDTFRPLKVARAALDYEDSGYTTSWLE